MTSLLGLAQALLDRRDALRVLRAQVRHRRVAPLAQPLRELRAELALADAGRAAGTERRTPEQVERCAAIDVIAELRGPCRASPGGQHGPRHRRVGRVHGLRDVGGCTLLHVRGGPVGTRRRDRREVIGRAPVVDTAFGIDEMQRARVRPRAAAARCRPAGRDSARSRRPARAVSTWRPGSAVQPSPHWPWSPPPGHCRCERSRRRARGTSLPPRGVSRAISVSVRGPRRYDSAQRVSNSDGRVVAARCASGNGVARGSPSAFRSALRSRPAVASAPSRPSITRALSRSVCSRPMNQVPALPSPL